MQNPLSDGLTAAVRYRAAGSDKSRAGGGACHYWHWIHISGELAALFKLLPHGHGWPGERRGGGGILKQPDGPTKPESV